MAADKFITVSGNLQALKQATDVSAGVANAGNIVALTSAGTLSPTVLPSGIGETTRSLVASEAISAGALVNVTSTGGVRNADAATQRDAQAYVLSAIANAASGIVYFTGSNSALTGLTPGQIYYLGAAGAVTATMPSASGSIIQQVGTAQAATALDFEAQAPIVIL